MKDEAKQWAREHLNGNKWNVWQALLVTSIITGCVSGVLGFIFPSTPDNPNMIGDTLSLIADIAFLPLSVGLVLYVVNLVRGNKFELGQLFSRYSDFVRIFVSNLLVGIWVFLFTLLLIVPGIIRAISYFLVNYILADDDFKDLSAGEVTNLSRTIMDGHKGEYFTLSLFYFFKMLLGVFTLGILWIWTVPEMNLAYVKFATSLLDDYKKNNKKEAKKEEKAE